VVEMGLLFSNTFREDMQMKWIIKDVDGNITNPCVLGDESWVKAHFDYVEEYVEPTAPELTAEEEARLWRDIELSVTDNTPSDHSQYNAIIAYRVSLRQWPQTADFPAIKPTLSS